MWNYIQLTAQIPTHIPEPDYFLKSIDTPFFMNLFRVLLAGGLVVMLAGIRFYRKKDSDEKEEG